MQLLDYAFSAIQALACAVDGEHICHVYDAGTRSEVRQFPVHHDFGGRRVALHPTMPRAYVGCYHIHGIAAYDLISGLEMWRVRSIKKIQYVHVDDLGDRILVGCEEGSLLVLNSANGKWIEKIRGAKQCWARDDVIIYHNRETFTIRRGLEKRKYKTNSFGVLCGHISEDTAYISVPGGSVYLVDLASLSMRSQYIPPKGHHVLQIIDDHAGRVVGLLRDYLSTGRQSLVDLDRHRTVSTLPDQDIAFLLEGGRMTMSNHGTFGAWDDE